MLANASIWAAVSRELRSDLLSEDALHSLTQALEDEQIRATFEVSGNQMADKSDAIQCARAIAEASKKPVMVWESDLPMAWIAPQIKIGRATHQEHV